MAKSKLPPPTSPSLTLVQGLQLLRARLKEGEELLATAAIADSARLAWIHSTKQAIRDTFGQDHEHAFYFSRQGSSRIVKMTDWGGGNADDEAEDREEVEAKLVALRAIIKEIEERQALQAHVTQGGQTPNVAGDEVFIVHGHDGETREATARVIQCVGLVPVILHEQANRGLTLIEKFEAHASKAGFAVVLITADDLGRSKAEPAGSERPRARQNVILELGFFLGKLGRSRVCAILEQGVERPSDYDGVVYIPKDARGKWKHDLGYELKEAGYEISLDRIR